MIRLASGIDYVDLNFLGYPEHHRHGGAAGPGRGGADRPGTDHEPPQSRSRHLAAAGCVMDDVRQILLTHIHLDHGGAAGTLVKAHPHIEVFVHERGAPHLADPAKLLSSASRLYGQDMDRLWGEFLAVPGDRLRVLQGGERHRSGGPDARGRVHARARLPSRQLLRPVEPDCVRGRHRRNQAWQRSRTSCRRRPPPDVDLERWRDSEARILAWDPDTLFLTHFGPFNGARLHFQELMDRLVQWSQAARRLVNDSTLSEDEREQRFVAEAVQDLRRVVGVAEAEQYSRAGSIAYSWQGLARYWRKKSQ